jgi:hypothetical protein
MTNRVVQIIGVIITVLSILIMIGIFYMNQRSSRKELTTEIISSSTLLNAGITNTNKDLRLIYKNKDIPNVVITNVRVSNTGSQPIRSSDIEVNLKIYMDCVEIISSKVASTNPKDMPISTSIEGLTVVISKALLNPGDDFIVETVAVQKPGVEDSIINITGRICGITDITYQKILKYETRDSIRLLIHLSALCIMIGILTSIFILLIANKSNLLHIFGITVRATAPFAYFIICVSIASIIVAYGIFIPTN